VEKCTKTNKGFNIFLTISNILNGTEENIKIDELEDFNVSEMVYFKFVPIMSMEVQRRFSQNKNL